MKSIIKKGFGYFKYNAKAIIYFGLLNTLLSCFVYDAVKRGSMILAMKVAGISYLGNNTIGKFLTSPFSWLMIFLSALVVTFFCLISVCSAISCFNASRLNIKVKAREIFALGLDDAKRVFKKKNFSIILYTLLLLPFVGSIEITSSSFSISIPGFILDAIFNNRLYSILFFALIVVLILVTINLIISIPIYTVENTDYRSACKKSIRLMKGKQLKFIWYRILLELVIVVPIALSGLALYGICFILTSLFNLDILTKIGLILFLLIVIFALFVSKYVNICFTTTFYFDICESGYEELPQKENLRVLTKLEKACIVIVVVATGICTYLLFGSSMNFAHSNNIVPAIAAHRGDSVRAPENSMPAFELAIEETYSSWIELDVHQTKDGVIVVSHDDYLGRIGIDKYVHDSTYAELMECDSGAYFSDDFKGLRLCTLQEALDLMKNKVSVQIEIKPTEFDNHIEEAVADIIHNTKTTTQIAVLSLKDAPLKRLKEIAPDIITIYCTIVASPGIEDLEYADWYSVEETCVSDELVNRIHNKGKKCFVWTINKKDNVQNLVDIGVDAILTDDPIMMHDTLSKCNYADHLIDSFDDFIDRIYKIAVSLFE